MNYHGYSQVIDNSYVSSPFTGFRELTNSQVGYNWYQSHPSSEGMAASPLHYPVEYRPPEPPPLSSHGNSPDFTFNPYYSPSHMLPYAAPPPSPNLHSNCAPYMYTPPFTLPCQPTLSTGQTYYTHESTAPVTTTTTIVDSPKLMDTPLTSATSVKGNQWEETLTKIMAILDRMQARCAVRSTVDDKTIQDEVVIGDGSRLGETVVEDEDNLQVDVLKSGRAVVSTVGGNDQADNNKLVKEAVEVQGELIVDAVEVEPQVFDKSPVRNSDLVVENMCEEGLRNADDSIIRMNLTIFQNFSSITEYVKEFMRIKSRAEFIFKCDFEDPILAYCFIEGLDNDIREALEFCAPQTLQEAIYLATFMESLFDESLLVESGVNTATYVNGLFAEIFGVGKQACVEALPSITLSNMEESVEAFVDMAEPSFTIPGCVTDPLKRLARNIDVSSSLNVMQLISQPRVKIANASKMGYGNAGKNFDPGGGTFATSLLTIVEGILELVLKVRVMSSISGDVSASYDHLLELQFQVLKNSVTAFIPPGFTSHENAFCGYHKVMEVGIEVRNKEKRKSMLNGGYGESEGITENVFEICSSLNLVDKNGDTKRYEKGEEIRVIELGMCVYKEFSEWARVSMTYGTAAWNVMLGAATTVFLYKLQQCILSWVSLKAIGVVKGKHLAFRRPGYGGNHWPRSCGNSDEVTIIVKLEMTCSCLAKNVKVMSKCRKPKWYFKLIDQAKFNVGNPLIFDLDALSFKHILSRFFEWEEFSEALDMVVLMHMSFRYPNESSFTSLLSSNVYLYSLCANGHVYCCVVIKVLTTYIASALFDCQTSNHSACRLKLLRGMTLGNLTFHEHQLEENFGFVHKRRRALAEFINFFGGDAKDKVKIASRFMEVISHLTLLLKRKWLFSLLDDFNRNQPPRNATCGEILFNSMSHKGTRVSISADGEIALGFFAAVAPPCFMTSGDSFKLHRKLVSLYPRDEELQANWAYDFIISDLENANDLTKHDEFEEVYDINDEHKSKEEGVGANQKKTNATDEREKYSSQLDMKPEVSLFGITALAWYWDVIIVIFDPGGLWLSSNALPMSFILEDKDILRGRNCNQLEICGPSGLAL